MLQNEKNNSAGIQSSLRVSFGTIVFMILSNIGNLIYWECWLQASPVSGGDKTAAQVCD